MNLWTFQHKGFFEVQEERLFAPEWNSAEFSWLPAYRWMAHQWALRRKNALLHRPVWCWHSVEGQIGKGPTVGTALMLLSEAELGSMAIQVAEVQVPDALPLLSSYQRWNALLDFVIDHPNSAIPTEQFKDMFEAPLMKDEDDSIQAIVPYIERTWLRRLEPFPYNHDHDDWDAPV